MSILGSLPPTSIHGTWVESLEVRSVDDDTLYDFSGLTEVRLMLRCQADAPWAGSGYGELVLTKTNGDIILPAPGIIQWRAAAGTMSRLYPGLYQVIMQLEDGTDTVPLILGEISIVG
jgi:hypothetical protein